MPLTLEIVTPEARVFSDTVETVVIPTVKGEIGILPGHIPLLTQVESGELRVTKDGRTTNLVVGAGFVQVEGDLVSVLAENAIREEQIDETAVEQAIARAEEALKHKDTLEPSEVDRLEAVFRFSLAQLGLKRRRR
jgi:F-type H+-transporting ATPase subunit epsilon